MARSSRTHVVSSRRGTQTFSAPTRDELPPGASRDGGQACTHCGASRWLRVTARRMVCMPGHGCQS
ncbi:hypothetical protein [Pseudofrankia sp. DC12]|uniref:hypothetical protein n=1 Tax=Pseudofrankia sp. DC12 TaxID=683315 RepID=UPI0005F76911|nr:hypothetical protein [Pseudofrankia sp. DC12]